MRLLRNQRGGVALLMVLGFMALGTPTVTGILDLSDSLSVQSRVNTDRLKRDYCGLAVSEYVRYLTLNSSRWDAWWAAPGRVISAPGAVPVIGEEVLNFGNCQGISFRLQLAQVPGNAPPVNFQMLDTTKTSDTANPLPAAQLEYAVVVANPAANPQPEALETIYDGLPLGFSYVLGTTRLNGVPFADPVESFPGQDDDQFCIFAQNDNLTIAKDDIILCSIGADDNIRIRNDAYIGGNVKSVNGNVDVDLGVTVTGDIRAGGNVTLGQGVTVGGTIRADGNVTLGQGATVTGNIRSGTGTILLGQSDVVGGDAVSLTGNVYVNQGSDLDGDIWAGGNVELRQSAVVDQNVWSLGNVDLKNSASVAIDVVAGGNVDLGQGATVTGTVTAQCQLPLCTIPPIPAWALFDGDGDRLMLTWDVSSAAIILQPGQSAILTFTVKAASEGGNYCNQAWADPGGTSTGSGMTAKATVGSPSSNLCVGENLVLTTTVVADLVATGSQPIFTYTTTIQNNGTTNVNFSMFRSKLPPGFSYVASSAKYVAPPNTNQIATAEPAVLISGGRERLTWYPRPFDSAVLVSGGTKTLIYQAQPSAALTKGTYRAETWAFFSEFASDETPYTWPTAAVQVMDPFEGTATDATGEIGSYEAWLGADFNSFRWTIR